MRRFWLKSGLQLYSNNRKQLNSAVSQSHVNTVHTSYSQQCHPPKNDLTLQTRSCLGGEWTISPNQTDNDTLYLQDEYLHYSQMVQYSSFYKRKKESSCAFPYYCTVLWPWSKNMNTFIHSGCWQVFSRAPSMAVHWQWHTFNHETTEHDEMRNMKHHDT